MSHQLTSSPAHRLCMGLVLILGACSDEDLDTKQQAQESSPTILYDFRVENANDLACEDDVCTTVGAGSESFFADEDARLVAMASENVQEKEQGETYDWPIVSGPASSLYTGAKVALFGIDSDFQNIPKVSLQIVDKCPSGGGTAVVSTASVSAGALRKKIRLSSPTTQIHGRCLYARMVGQSVPSGGWKVWAASMAFSNDPDLH